MDDDHDIIPMATARVLHDDDDVEDEDDDEDGGGGGDDDDDDDGDDDDDNDDAELEDEGDVNDTLEDSVDNDDPSKDDVSNTSESNEDDYSQSQSNNASFGFGMSGENLNSSSEEEDVYDESKDITSDNEQKDDSAEEDSDGSEAKEALEDYEVDDEDEDDVVEADVHGEAREAEEEMERLFDASFKGTTAQEESNADDNDNAPEQTQLEAWKQVHEHLAKAVMVARKSVEAKKRQRRFWLETICANLTPEGKLTSKSTWLRPTAVDLRNYRKIVPKKPAKLPATTKPKTKVPKRGLSSIVKGRKRLVGSKLMSDVMKPKKTLKKISISSTQSKKRKAISKSADPKFNHDDDNVEAAAPMQKKKHRLKLSIGNAITRGKQLTVKDETRVNNDDSDDGDDSMDDDDDENVAVEVRQGSDDDKDSDAFGGESDANQNTNNDMGDSYDDNDDDSDDEDSKNAASDTLTYPLLQSIYKPLSVEPEEANDAGSSEDDSPMRARHPYLDAPRSSFNQNSFSGVQAGLDSEQIYSTYNASGDRFAAAAAESEESESEVYPF
jgi:hypothetical protein